MGTETGREKTVWEYRSKYSLSLLDIDRLISFISKIVETSGENVRIHLRVGEQSVEISKAEMIRPAIGKIENFGALSYIAVSSLHNFMITADFKVGELQVTCKNDHLLHELKSKWEECYKTSDIAKDLLSIAVPLEGARFLFACLADNGSLNESPGGKTQLDNVFLVPYLKELGMRHILTRFANFLKTIQNPDGGWGPSPGLSSKALSTASVVLALIGSGQKEHAKRGVDFLLSNRLTDGSWTSNADSCVLTSAISTLALHQYGVKEDILRSSVLFVKNQLSQRSEGIENDSLVLRALRTMNIDIQDLSTQIQNRLPESATAITNVSSKTTTAACLVSLLLDLGIETTDPRIQLATDFLIESRNSDGGWPSKPSNHSVIYPTILAMLVFDRLGYLR